MSSMSKKVDGLKIRNLGLKYDGQKFDLFKVHLNGRSVKDPKNIARNSFVKLDKLHTYAKSLPKCHNMKILACLYYIAYFL